MTAHPQGSSRHGKTGKALREDYGTVKKARRITRGVVSRMHSGVWSNLVACEEGEFGITYFAICESKKIKYLDQNALGSLGNTDPRKNLIIYDSHSILPCPDPFVSEPPYNAIPTHIPIGIPFNECS